MITYLTDEGETRILTDEWIPAGDRALLLKDAGPRSARRLRRCFAEIDANEARWNAEATLTQQRVSWGDHFRQDFPGDAVIGPVVVYGRVLTLFEVIDAEERAGASTAEIDQLVARIKEGYRRGWRHVRGYSPAEPAGETGYTHVGNLWPITAEEFEAAKALGWPQ